MLGKSKLSPISSKLLLFLIISNNKYKLSIKKEDMSLTIFFSKFSKVKFFPLFITYCAISSFVLICSYTFNI